MLLKTMVSLSNVIIVVGDGDVNVMMMMMILDDTW